MRAILTFHSIDESGSVLSFDAHLFDQLLAELAKQNIPVVDLTTLITAEDRPGVTITFDDGMRSLVEHALPILKKHAVGAHLFLSTEAVGAGRQWPQASAGMPAFEMLDWNEVEQLHRCGVSIEGHTHTHPDMRSLAPEQMLEECQRADELIADRLGRAPEYFAYPYGYHNTAARQFARSRYAGTVTTELRPLGRREDTAALPRLDSYYLRTSWRLRHFNSTLLSAYLALRNRLRTFRGSQCVADQD